MSEAPAKHLCGLIGAGIQRSLTPAMQEEEARAQGLRLHYQLVDLDRAPQGADALPGLLDAARTMGFAGLNITYPCKQAVIPLLDELSDEARAMGAVNTVVADGARWVGHNTDGSGWRAGFERQLPGADLSRVVLLGAGGAGSAIAHALVDAGVASLAIHEADAARRDALIDKLRRYSPLQPTVGSADPSGMDLAINATPMGMRPDDPLPIDVARLAPTTFVGDVVTVPSVPPLIEAARARGCGTMNGIGMFEAVRERIVEFYLATP